MLFHKIANANPGIEVLGHIYACIYIKSILLYQTKVGRQNGTKWVWHRIQSKTNSNYARANIDNKNNVRIEPHAHIHTTNNCYRTICIQQLLKYNGISKFKAIVCQLTLSVVFRTRVLCHWLVLYVRWIDCTIYHLFFPLPNLASFNRCVSLPHLSSSISPLFRFLFQNTIQSTF